MKPWLQDCPDHVGGPPQCMSGYLPVARGHAAPCDTGVQSNTACRHNYTISPSVPCSFPKLEISFVTMQDFLFSDFQVGPQTITYPHGILPRSPSITNLNLDAL